MLLYFHVGSATKINSKGIYFHWKSKLFCYVLQKFKFQNWKICVIFSEFFILLQKKTWKSWMIISIIYILIIGMNYLSKKNVEIWIFFSLFFSKVASTSALLLISLHRNFSKIWSNLKTIPWYLSQPKWKYTPQSASTRLFKVFELGRHEEWIPIHLIC